MKHTSRQGHRRYPRSLLACLAGSDRTAGWARDRCMRGVPERPGGLAREAHVGPDRGPLASPTLVTRVTRVGGQLHGCRPRGALEWVACSTGPIQRGHSNGSPALPRYPVRPPRTRRRWAWALSFGVPGFVDGSAAMAGLVISRISRPDRRTPMDFLEWPGRPTPMGVTRGTRGSIEILRSPSRDRAAVHEGHLATPDDPRQTPTRVNAADPVRCRRTPRDLQARVHGCAALTPWIHRRAHRG